MLRGRYKQAHFSIACRSPGENKIPLILRALKGASVLKEPSQGRKIHADSLLTGYVSNICVSSSLVSMYSRFGSLSEARQVFENMSSHDVLSWSAILLAYAENGEESTTLELLPRMKSQGLQPDCQTYVALFKAIINLSDREKGRKVNDHTLVKLDSLVNGMKLHSEAVLAELEMDIIVSGTLVEMYARCGSIHDARLVFDRLPLHDVVIWTSLILGYVLADQPHTGVKLFVSMQLEGCPPTAQTYVAALKACTGSVNLETGRVLHEEVWKPGVEKDVVMVNCLVDLYAKCGCMTEARRIFDSAETRDAVLWTALIAGYSRLGDTDQVFELFERMQEKGARPNEITYTFVLAACSHAGLVDRGTDYFDCMERKHGVSPDIGHYHGMIDLLGRANRLEEAAEMVKRMPYEPNSVTWMTLLAASSKWSNVSVGKLAYDALLVRGDVKVGAPFVLMANMLSEATDKIGSREQFVQTQTLVMRGIADKGSLEGLKKTEELPLVPPSASKHLQKPACLLRRRRV